MGLEINQAFMALLGGNTRILTGEEPADKPVGEIEKDTNRDFYLSAEEAKKYGIIDEVIKGKK